MIRISILRCLEGAENNSKLGLRHHGHNDFVNTLNGGKRKKRGEGYVIKKDNQDTRDISYIS